MLLENKVALVTGAGQGIGRQIALTLANEGASVAVCDINPALSTTKTGYEVRKGGVNEVSDIPEKSTFFRVDVSDVKSVEECTQNVLDTLKKIDILVNNAGITRDALLVRMKDEDWDLVLKVNLTGTFNFTKAVARHMMRQRSGKIINIASIIGLIGNIGQTNYAASKAGIIGLTKSCARELAPRGITVNAVAPGFITTQMTERIPEDIKQKMLENIPLSKFGATQDVANTVLFLASPLADYITGQVINVCGGLVM